MQGSANVSIVSAKFQENSEPHILHNLLGAEAEEGKVIMVLVYQEVFDLFLTHLMMTSRIVLF